MYCDTTALKAAYDALSYETARQHSDPAHHSNQTSNAELQTQLAESAALLVRANELTASLEQQLEESQRAVRELQKLPGMLNAAEEKLRAAVADKTKVWTNVYICVRVCAFVS